ncbi:hypothetical protein BD309DRAFT_945092 [Dichomitus squalens]|nr:hypothetical protein BD309DRAFT_945092 [Dichomitus squalens]
MPLCSLTPNGSLLPASLPSSKSSSPECPPNIPNLLVHISRGFVQYLEPCDIADFKAAKDLLPKYLDLSRTWTKQEKASISGLVTATASGFPIFAKYKGHWHIER